MLFSPCGDLGKVVVQQIVVLVTIKLEVITINNNGSPQRQLVGETVTKQSHNIIYNVYNYIRDKSNKRANVQTTKTIEVDKQ